MDGWMDSPREEHVTPDRRDAEQGERVEQEIKHQHGLESGDAEDAGNVGMDSVEKQETAEVEETDETEETKETGEETGEAKETGGTGASEKVSMTTTTASTVSVTNESSTTIATLSELRQEADVIEDDVRRLVSMMKVVNQSLTNRTSDAAILTSSHARTTRDVSHVALAATTRLDDTTRKFLQNITRLRQNFRTITALSQATSQVRAQVLRLETQVSRL